MLEQLFLFLRMKCVGFLFTRPPTLTHTHTHTQTHTHTHKHTHTYVHTYVHTYTSSFQKMLGDSNSSSSSSSSSSTNTTPSTAMHVSANILHTLLPALCLRTRTLNFKRSTPQSVMRVWSSVPRCMKSLLTHFCDSVCARDIECVLEAFSWITDEQLHGKAKGKGQISEQDKDDVVQSVADMLEAAGDMIGSAHIRLKCCCCLVSGLGFSLSLSLSLSPCVWDC